VNVQRVFIGGQWAVPSTGHTVEVVSPHTALPIGRVAAAGPDDVDRVVATARAAVDAGPWPRLDPSGPRDAEGGLA